MRLPITVSLSADLAAGIRRVKGASDLSAIGLQRNKESGFYDCGWASLRGKTVRFRLSHRTTFGERAPDFAIRPAVHWNRFSSCWDTYLCKRRSGIWAANSDSATR